MSKFAVALLLASTIVTVHAHAAKKTVCTITVNSPDEKEAFRARLPKGEYEFVELVEKGRDDWLRSSCERKVQCDVLVISGHFNAGETFYSDKNEIEEHLQVDELERASCSQSCPALFANLKEVYLFGCESLNPDAAKYSSRYGESGRERMRRIFANVPGIYGFSGAAPVGPTAAMLLNRTFDAGGGSAFATGQNNQRLLNVFARNHMVRVSGVSGSEAQSSHRAQICEFFDERKGPAQKVAYIHALMRRDMGEARVAFARIEKLFASLTEAERQAPAFQHALAEISADDATRDRYLGFERATRDAGMRARMIDLAAMLGWLTPEARRGEMVAMIDDLLASHSMGFAEVDLVCTANADGALDAAAASVHVPPAKANGIAQAAVMACLGNPDARERTIRALASPDERDVQIAQSYLRLRPVSDAKELRVLARDVTRMPGSSAQVRALDALARLNISDRQILADLTRSFAEARSASVQRAIAEIFIRSDPKALPRPDLAAALRDHRLRAPGGGGSDLIDVLLARLQ